MQIIIHRVNTIEHLRQVPHEYGVEIDVRAYSKKVILHHEPYEKGVELEKWLKHYKHAFIIFNIKDSGIENDVIRIAERHGIEEYFLLDVELYWIHNATTGGFSKIAIRYSENEPIELALHYKKKAQWLWIDVPTKLPIAPKVIKQMRGYRTCLVCPERWGRPEEIPAYARKMKRLKFRLDAVMTSLKYADDWIRLMQ